MKRRAIFLNGKELTSTEQMERGLENAIDNAADYFEELHGEERADGVHTSYDGDRIDVIEIEDATGAKVQDILKAFWAYKDDYDGDVAVNYYKEQDGYTFYRVCTDGNDFVAAICNNPSHAPDANVVFYTIWGGRDWQNTDGTPTVELGGVPRIVDGTEPRKTAAELAAESGKSVGTVYHMARQLGRLPTVEELKAEKKAGRPRKY